MQYRRFGRLDWDASVLGFGIMRLPLTGSDPAAIDEDRALDMVRSAIDAGVNYIDTAYPYHGGRSEAFVGRALQGGYRRKVKVATKMPVWLVDDPVDFDRYLDEQRERLQTGHIDLYLLHALNRTYWDKLKAMGVLDWAVQRMADGAFGHLGFSFHDQFEVFRDIVDAWDGWDFCQIQYNYMDEDYQAGRRGLRYAADRGLPVVVMEPLRGGQLTRTPPTEIADLFTAAARRRTPADWALQWLWDQPEVTVVLSGMSTMQQVRENLASAEAARAGSLSRDDHRLIEQVREVFARRCPIACTQCRYCLPCSHGVDIPRNLELYNDAVMYDDWEQSRKRYADMKAAERADMCQQCGECEEACPQQLPVQEWLAECRHRLAPAADGS